MCFSFQTPSTADNFDYDGVAVDYDDNVDQEGDVCDSDGTVCRRLDEGGDGEFPRRFTFEMKINVTQLCL